MQAEDSEFIEASASEKGSEGNDSIGETSESDGSKECESEELLLPSENEYEISGESEFRQAVQLPEESEPKNEENHPEESELKKEVQEGEPELQKETGPEKQVHLPKERDESKIREWAQIRPSLAAIEIIMSSRVKRGNNIKEEQEVESRGDRLSLVTEVRGKFKEETSADDLNASREESTAGIEVAPEPFIPWKDELQVLVRGGIPKDLRGEVWQAFVGVRTRRVERYYQDLLAQVTNADESNDHNNASRKWKRQIEKDIPRTFPGHPALNDDGRDSLRRLLLAYARHNPSVGYCQAMNFFAGLLLLLMPEENAFWTFVGIIDEYFDGYYAEEMIESQVDQLVFEELMRERFPKLVNHLDYLGVQVAWISGPWFLSIFVNMLPWESVLRVWDVLLFEGNRVMLFRTALALMELYGPALVTTKDAGDAITLLQSLAGSTFDSSQLVLTACMGYLAVTEARLQELREKHRPAVLVVVEERSKRGRVWKDSKGLASKLYSFKHDAGSVLEEKRATEGCVNPNADRKGTHEPRSSNLDELLCGITVESEADSVPDLQEQVVWLKVELCRILEEKRSTILRAEELETALMEMVKQDNRRQLSARIEQLEQEVAELQQLLADKKEQEAAMLQVLMRVEQEQRVTEDARISAEQDAAAQRYAVHVLQEKYEKAMAAVAQMEKRVVMAESMLEATLQYESGQAKAQSSPRSQRQSFGQDSPRRKTGLLSFGLGWRDRNKDKRSEESSDSKSPTEAIDPNTCKQESAAEKEK